ncbi:methionyl-tRNA formyltransferase [Carboxylicivirga taeanensis]|uniref:methionyl-tRNA formyltransferase n=1 Tax=Carboxylicivirga taeanensis TaxID=1416875 RepID=UPI003F6E1BB9
MIRVVFLGMGGPITTMVLNSLLNHNNVELMCLIKPYQNVSSNSYGKKILKKLPLFIQKIIRSCRIKYFKIDNWQLPDLVSYYNINVLTTSNVNSKDTIKLIESFKPDLIVVANFNQILKKEVLAIPHIGCINVHPSLLPEYRGANPIFWMFKNNEQFGGATIHFIDEGIDSGRIIKQSKFSLSEEETVLSYTKKCGKAAAKDLENLLDLFSINAQLPIKEPSETKKYYRKPTKEDGELLLTGKPELVFRNYNVMKNYVPVYLTINNKQFTIIKAKFSNRKKVKSKSNVFVYSSDNKVLIFKGKYNA